MPGAAAMIVRRVRGTARQISRVSLMFCGCCVAPCLAAGAATVEAEGSAASSSRLALLDVSYVLRNYSAFQQRKAEIDTGVALAEVVAGQRQQEIRELAQRLKMLQAGSPEHTELELTILRRTAELKTQLAAARQKCTVAEARAYADAYREIVRVVNQYLEETDYWAVLRKNRLNDEKSEGRPSDAGRPHNKDFSRSIVFAQAGVDISDEILRRLNTGRLKTMARMQKEARR